MDHLINEGGQRECRCSLHEVPNPFSSFSQVDKDIETSSNIVENTTEPGLEPQISNEQSQFGVGSPIPRTVDIKDMSFMMNISESVLDSLVMLDENHEKRIDEGRYCDVSQMTSREHIPNEDINLVAGQDSRDTTVSIILPPSPSIMPGGIREENLLFFHYVSHISGLMIPIDDASNPWKSTYPSIAVQDVSSCSTRSLYHAILAQSALHLANSKGPERGVEDNASALRHYGIALRELRDSLAAPTEEYSSVLAALLTIILIETVAQGKFRTWRHHFRGAIGFVTQYLAQKPWLLSRDAWNITQSFALNVVIAQTAGNYSTKTDHISKIYSVLCDVTNDPRFGFTIGGNARLIKAIYRTLLLEEQISAARHTRGNQVVDENIAMQAEDIIQQLRDSLTNDVELYIKHREVGGLSVLPRTRTLVKLHLHLFYKAVMIYLFRMVLQYPPSAVADYVCEVLTNAIAFLDMNSGEPSIWPIFIAAVEAYTPESQALANHFFDECKTRGTGLREDVRSVVCQVWADREQLSEELQCSPGEVSINWREVNKRLHVDILLL